MLNVKLPDNTVRATRSQTSAGLINVSDSTGTRDHPAPFLRAADATSRFVDGRGNLTTTELDALSRPTLTIDEVGRMTRTVRDTDGNATRTTRPNGSVVTRTFDDEGNVLTEREEFNGATTRYAYDPFSLITEVTNPNNHTTTFERDAQGNVTQITNAKGHATIVEYDTRGLVTQMTDPVGLVTTFGYNAEGLLETMTETPPADSAGETRTTQYAYDDAGLLSAMTSPDGITYRYTYDVTPFALTSGSQFRPPPPAMYPDPAYTEQVEALIKLTARLNDRQKVIAEYWADGPQSETPPGHWNLFARFVSYRDQHSLDEDVKLYFALNNALMDAGIAAWDAKRVYDYVRPISAIRFLKQGETIRAWVGPYEGIHKIDGSKWRPYQPLAAITPPFSEYVSGHSTFSAAAAEVLRAFTGSDAFGASYVRRAGESIAEPGLVPKHDLTLRWATFTHAADQAGMSRRYGGIHFAAADLYGRQMGTRIGVLAWAKAQTYFQGTAAMDDTTSLHVAETK